MGVKLKVSLVILVFGVLFQNSSGQLENVEGSGIGFRFQASLQTTSFGDHTCGGAIITQKWLVTTADCANRIRSNPYVTVGSYKLKQDPRLTTVKVSNLITHEQFNQGASLANNIALLQLERPLEYTETILNVRLPPAQRALPDSGSLCGWKPTITNELQLVRNIQVQTSNCKTSTNMDVPLSSGEFCGNVEKREYCLMDLGGALVKDGVLHGILSRTDCVMNPEIFTQVSKYADWIKNKLGNDAGDIKWDNDYPGGGGGGGVTDPPGGASAAQSSAFVIALVSGFYVMFQLFH